MKKLKESLSSFAITCYRNIGSNFSSYLLVLLTAINFLMFYKIFAKETLIVNYQPELFIRQQLGNIHFYHSLNIKNIGRGTGFITKIEGYIRSKDRDQAIFRRKIIAKSFYNGSANNNSSPFMEIVLSENGYFGAEIEMYKEPDRVTRDSVSIINALMLSEADNDEKNSTFRNFKAVEASPRMAAIIDNFNKNRTNELKQGEYEYIIQITKNNEPKPFSSMCYSFFIYPDNIFVFTEAIKDYKRYDRIFWSGRRPSLGIPLTEINNPQIIKSLEDEFQK